MSDPDERPEQTPGIAKGRDWGTPGSPPPDAPEFDNDRELGTYVEQNPGSCGSVRSGDLARTLGLRADHAAATSRFLVPIDAIRVELDDGTLRLAMAHVVVGHLIVAPGAVAIMNASFIGALNVAPRAHPGDHELDVVSFDLGMADRLKAYRRMPTGTHVPHPGIKTLRMPEGTLSFDRPRRVSIDGLRAGRTRSLRFEVVPAAVTLAV